jgi:hypothetical protein
VVWLVEEKQEPPPIEETDFFPPREMQRSLQLCPEQKPPDPTLQKTKTMGWPQHRAQRTNQSPTLTLSGELISFLSLFDCEQWDRPDTEGGAMNSLPTKRNINTTAGWLAQEVVRGIINFGDFVGVVVGALWFSGGTTLLSLDGHASIRRPAS